jgi:hypothetical protein
MSRVQYADVVISPNGRPVPGISVTVTPVSGSSATKKLWASETGSGELLAITTDSAGVFSVWLDEGRYDITPAGAQTKRVEIVSDTAIGCPLIADNATDNSATIQAAVDAAAGAGGGEVILRVTSGTLGVAIGRWVSKPHVIVVGPGSQALTIRAPSGSADVVSGLNFATLTGKTYAAGDYLLGAPQSGVKGLTLDGNATANYGYRVWGAAQLTDDLIVQNCVQGGLWTEFTDVDSFADPAQKLKSSFGTVKSIGNGGEGWTMRGPHDSMCTDYVAYSNTGWALTVDSVESGYDGGITFAHFNSFLNTLGSARILNGGFIDIISGALSGSNTGTGLELSAGSGGSRVRCAIAGHTTGIHLRGSGHRIDVTLASNNPGDVIKLDGCQKCFVSIGGGAGNTNILNNVSEGGPNFIDGVVDIGEGDTFKSGAAWNTQTVVLVAANGAGGNLSEVKLPSATLHSSNGSAPLLPQSNGTLVAGTEAAAIASPAETVAALKKAVDELRTVVKAYGMTE